MIYKNYFNIEEFLIEPKYRQEGVILDVPMHVVNKIINYHLPVLNDIRDKLNAPVYISKHSGYRPIAWELERNRSGNSEHTFQGLGAVDLTCAPEHFNKLIDLCIKSAYHRVIIYPNNNFVHCDYKGNNKHLYHMIDGELIYKGKR